ncbi:MAG: hypothetical protein ACHQVK_04210, partial [Candidatus Paceibacterales bacterium]
VVKSVSSSDVKPGYSLVTDKSKQDIKDLKTNKDNTISANLVSSAFYAPDISTDKIPQQISGKTESAVEKNLETNSQIAHVSVVLKNKIPFLPLILPLNPRHITVTVHTE